MAYMRRGSNPIPQNNDKQKEHFKETIEDYERMRWIGNNYYLPLDKNYIATQIITTLVVLVIVFATYIITYKSTIIDPILSIKRTYLNMHCIIIGILLILNILTSLLSKNKENLVKRLAIIFFISVIVMTGFFIKRIDYDKKYTQSKFEQLYNEQNFNEEYSNRQMIDISIGNMGLKTQKEYYIDECIKLYNIFKTKTYVTLGVHSLLNILFMYQISKISKKQSKKDRINKDDAILFDEEENIKF